MVFGVLFFFMWQILSNESDSAYDYLNEIKVGSATKRWQSAFELAKILGNPDLIPKEKKFVDELKRVYRSSIHDDPQVRTYLALAMGATRNLEYGEVLIEGLKDDNIQSQISSIKSLGQIGYKKSIPLFLPLLKEDVTDDLRLSAIMAIGMIGDSSTTEYLFHLLEDQEVNIRWEAAVALAKLKDYRAVPVIKDLLQREYLQKFPKVDDWEQVQAILVAIHVSGILKSDKFIPYLEKLALHDINMKIRDSAIKTLKKVYNKDVG
tara:strand:+ start:386 stop:1177 length:792 start_codon:yes stop_codon:yes gene_type:complete